MTTEQFSGWRKSRRSEGDAQCVEIGRGDGGSIGVRDSKNIDGPHVAFTRQAWSLFLSGTRHR
ncbi:DUF397 domain-containing protein [Actinocorallia sp. API 0066]|uniref:DUF397 domain-containing protein n=1 Tax=Actinocorallia sp. API 0066 TaxID=2896846 RepID=UPI001E493331|nr:DUF397 domain-containing protein [Actinocorallia sp. API 0066]MCD0452232.1 DUF397 domain-containing protein [Actinocorallia sp. API 0066]